MGWINELINDENAKLKMIYNDYRDECIEWLNKNYNISREDSIEVFQNAVIILYDNVIQQKVTESSSLKTYLFGIAKNKAYEFLRYRKKLSFIGSFDLPLIMIQEESNMDNKKEQEKLFNSLYDALLKLGDPCKSLLNRFYLKKMKMIEIQKIMGYENKDSVKTAKYKCMQRLKKLIA